MTIWRSPHPDLEIPTDCTTYQHFFENPLQPELTGAYENALTKERVPFAQVKEYAEILSTIFVQHYSLLPGDTVSLFSTNSVWYPVAVWATVRFGGRVNGASPSYTVDETIHALKTADTKLLLTLPQSLPTALAAARAVGLPESHIILLEGSSPSDSKMSTLQGLLASKTTTTRPFEPIPTYRIPHPHDNRSICGYLSFSSGTTGLPKAVMLSHHNIIAQCQQLRQLQVYSASHAASIEHSHGLPQYRILAVMPLFHITGLVRFVSYPVFLDGLCVMLPQYTLPSMIKAITTYEIEELILVPPILLRLVQDPVVDQHLDALRRIVKRWSSGSAPIAPEVTRMLERKFPGTGFRQGYGATESTACISCHPPELQDYKYATTGGQLVANTTAKVVALPDPTSTASTTELDERLLGVGEIGEICAKGPQIAMGYLGNAAATRETFDFEGYLHTGDVGYIDDLGMINVVDRIKEMIKVKGQQVAPAELEDILLGRDEVADCAVIGISDARSGEVPKAFVVLKQSTAGCDRREAGMALLEYVRSRLVRYKHVQEIEFVEAVPKSPTGKLLRRVLKGWQNDKARPVDLVVRVEKAKL